MRCWYRRPTVANERKRAGAIRGCLHLALALLAGCLPAHEELTPGDASTRAPRGGAWEPGDANTRAPHAGAAERTGERHSGAPEPSGASARRHAGASAPDGASRWDQHAGAREPGETNSWQRGGDPSTAGGGGTALALLSALPVRERGPRAGYARDQFGPAWADVDRNGCDTRNDVLRRDLEDAVIEDGTRDCVVVAGRLADPYTGAEIEFVKGRASHVDIDHVVALADAWTKGAAAWPIQKRTALANDPLNLLAVDASANRAKGDADAAEWLPPRRAFHCAYVARQVAVKAKYGLWVTAAEREAMARVLKTCPDEPVPTSEAPVRRPESGRSRGPKSEARAEQPAKGRAIDPNYGTCKEAKAHGAGPYYRGRDPEYEYYQDRDGDGVVCE